MAERAVAQTPPRPIEDADVMFFTAPINAG